MVPGHVNHSDDQLAFLAFYSLLQYEKDPYLREVFQDALRRSWKIERHERNPLWNFIYAAGTASTDFDLKESIQTLYEIPMDSIGWYVKNSDRKDIPIDNNLDSFSKKQSIFVLPYQELPLLKWNANPFALDGGLGGKYEDEGSHFLLPYWLGRHHRLIEIESK